MCGRSEPAQKFGGKLAVAGGGGAGVIVLINRPTVAGRLGEPDGTGDDGLEHLRAEVLAEVIADLLAEAGAGIVHGKEYAQNGEVGIQAAFADFFNEVENFADPLQGKVFALDRDEDAFGGHEGAGHEEADAGRAIEDDEIKGGVVFQGGEGLADAEEGVLKGSQFDLGPGQIQFRGQHLKAGLACRLKHFHRAGLAEENGVEALAGDGFEAESAGGVGLGVEVDQEDAVPSLRRAGGKMNGGGRLADATFLVHHGHDAHRTGNDGGGRVVESIPSLVLLTRPSPFSIFLFLPMISVENLSKRYAGGEAVKGITFSVEKGEVVGFLGPNGAGKSTTMRMLTGYLPATDGKIEIAGAKLPEQSLLVRQRIGYMPENVPLYPEMRVEEFLEYRGRLKRVSRAEIAHRTGLVLDQCGLTDVRHKIIGTLSKGFRQRVGLADALIHNPVLLILDEPTAGLDPHQIRSFRELIKELGKDRTILLSTHILSEVEMVCTRAIIINRGRIEASDTLANLEKRVQAGALQVEIKAEAGSAKEKLKALPDVSLVNELNRAGEWISFEVMAVPGKDIRGEVDGLIKRENWPLREFRREKARLEDVFVELTQE